jgi:O-antigen ligase
MVRPRLSGSDARPGPSFLLLALLFGILWIAGGASRGDAVGQVVVRVSAWAALIAAMLFSRSPAWRDIRFLLGLTLAALALPLLQLIPLPPSIWQSLPGRDVIERAAIVVGEPQPWRPWSMVPGATLNAASSLIVPLVTLLLIGALRPHERSWLPGLLLATICGSMLVGLLQFSGTRFDQPLVNDTVGEVSGLFANRNHFALFMAIGCVLAPGWAFLGRRRPKWRGPMALALVLLFALMILASGSRAGLLLGAVGLIAGLVIAWHGIRGAMSRYPRWVFPALIGSVVAIIAGFILVSVAADRAVAIDRVIAIDPGQDMRSRGLPTVLGMIERYFPFGTGLGSFDPLFRIHEPLSLLKPTYFNHAHNDLLEIALDAGLPGLLLFAVMLAWWGLGSLRAWRSGAGTRHGVPKMGSAILLLVLVASLFDYPSRTPLMMATIVLAAWWLHTVGRSALPDSDDDL